MWFAIVCLFSLKLPEMPGLYKQSKIKSWAKRWNYWSNGLDYYAKISLQILRIEWTTVIKNTTQINKNPKMDRPKIELYNRNVSWHIVI